MKIRGIAHNRTDPTLNIAELTDLPKKVPVTVNFNWNRIIGTATVDVDEDGNLVAEIEVPEHVLQQIPEFLTAAHTKKPVYIADVIGISVVDNGYKPFERVEEDLGVPTPDSAQVMDEEQKERKAAKEQKARAQEQHDEGGEG